MALLYRFGSVMLFLGLMWMFFPHFNHDMAMKDHKVFLTESYLESTVQDQYAHLWQGLIGTLLGLGMLFYSSSQESREVRVPA